MGGDGRSPQLSPRAALTGVALGAPLALCNLYLSLKLALSLNMAVAAAVVALALWRGLAPLFGRAPFALLENNAAQTVASAAAFISSAGLSAALPALALLTGEPLPYWALSLWLFAVCLLGILLAVPLRQLYVEGEALPFATGVATATVLRQLHADAAHAAAQVRLLVGGAAAGALAVLLVRLASIPTLLFPGGMSVRAGGAVAWSNLGVGLPPTGLFYAIGALVGPRIGLSLLFGACLAWGLGAPVLLDLGLVAPGGAEELWFSRLAVYLVWPGAGVMVAAAVTSLVLSVLSHLGRRAPTRGVAVPPAILWGLGGVSAALVLLQIGLFGLSLPHALLAVALALPLALVAARVSGETAVTPAAPVGKVSQLVFGLTHAQPVANLVAGNVAAGAASQCADLLDDLKAGALLGASTRQLTAAQILGAATGALTGAAAFLLLFPDPRRQLGTAEWPAPAAATWRTLAEALAGGLAGLPPGAIELLLLGAAFGVALVALERLGPSRWRRFCPSAASVGLAFVVPAYVAVAVAVGALLALAWRRLRPSAAETGLWPLAAGLIAGESLAGVALALGQIAGG